MSGNSTFLPEEYVKAKTEAVKNVICAVLFVVVMFGTLAAFLVTTRRSTAIHQQKSEVDAQYAKAATSIEELRKLQDQKATMLERAELAAALVERVPRSILLAELINRMPAKVSLLEFELASEKIRQIKRPAPSANTPKSRSGRLAPNRRPGTVDQAVAEGERARVAPPKFMVEIAMTGVAPTDREVANFLTQLNAYPLFHDVRLDYSEETTMEDVLLREFRIELKLDPDSDIREVDPLVRDRELRNPIRRGITFPAGGSDEQGG